MGVSHDRELVKLLTERRPNGGGIRVTILANREPLRWVRFGLEMDRLRNQQFSKTVK